jgi:hypothetical protein
MPQFADAWKMEFEKKWGGRRDLNPRPSESQSDALTN